MINVNIFFIELPSSDFLSMEFHATITILTSSAVSPFFLRYRHKGKRFVFYVVNKNKLDKRKIDHGSETLKLNLPLCSAFFLRTQD